MCIYSAFCFYWDTSARYKKNQCSKCIIYLSNIISAPTNFGMMNSRYKETENDNLLASALKTDNGWLLCPTAAHDAKYLTKSTQKWFTTLKIKFLPVFRYKPIESLCELRIHWRGPMTVD